MRKKYIIVITFIWIGFVCAISFMEAWVKFKAPGITTPLGLSIGKVVFGALNRVEVVCAFLILILSLIGKENRELKNRSNILVPIAILFLQTVWLLPALNARASLIIANENVIESILHLWYVLLEITKVTFLFVYGIRSLEKIVIVYGK